VRVGERGVWLCGFLIFEMGVEGGEFTKMGLESGSGGLRFEFE
jgi:hypothetical protein